MRRALITGVTGQDGSYLAELLLEKGYEVCGLVLPDGREPLDNIRHLIERVTLVAGDLTAQASLDCAVEAVEPDEVYNFAAQSAVPLSWTQPVMTGDVTALGAARLFEAVRRKAPRARVFQASSAGIFGNPGRAPQDESTPVRPTTPYGAAKAYAHFLADNYRRQHGLFIACGILYNHESPRRGPDFVTRKVTLAAARIRRGLQSELRMGSLDAVRDWGYAPDYVEGMWRMLQQDRPGDYVLASGEPHTVRDLAAAAFSALGLDWRRHVVRDESLVRPDEPVPLVGDPGRARRELGWSPSCSFREMVSLMAESDIEAAAQEAAKTGVRA